MRISRGFAAAVLACAGLSSASSAWAWPDKPVDLVVGFAPGGGTDITARTLAIHLAREIGGQVVVSNRPGASGAIGLSFVARARPDGHTIAMTNMPGLVTLPIERDAGFKGADFAYLGNLVRDPSAVSVVIDSPYKTLAEMLAVARKAPGTVSFGSTGVGTDDHLQMVLLEAQTGVKFLHVPFPGAAPLRIAMMGGHVVVGSLNLGEVMPFAGKTMRALAQANEARSPLGPEIPTYREQGVDVVIASERGIVAPKGLPPEVEQKLAAALKRIAENPEFQAQVKAQFTEMDYLPGTEWKKRLDAAEGAFRQMWAKKPWNE
jgi:tripartite-type tricarboxylate transporter receptor subunit TctC